MFYRENEFCILVGKRVVFWRETIFLCFGRGGGGMKLYVLAGKTSFRFGGKMIFFCF